MEDEPILAEVDGEGMLIDVNRGISFFLNESGVLIYKMLKQGKTEEEIKAVFLNEYDVDEKEAEKDIQDFRNIIDEKVISWEKRNTSNRK